MSEDNNLAKSVVSPFAPYFAISRKRHLDSPHACFNKHTYLHSKRGERYRIRERQRKKEIEMEVEQERKATEK
jgi:hypothetical protein